MTSPLLNDLFVTGTRDSLLMQQPDGSVGNENWAPRCIHPWAICYSTTFEGNPYYKSADLLDAITRLGDYNQRSFAPGKGFTENIPGFDEWRQFAWMEALELVKDDLDADRRAAWTDTFLQFGQNVMDHCIDMDHFDGAIPNHGIWNHAMFYRIGQLYDRPEFMEMADFAFSRIFASQTADGCFREGETAGGMQGTPVTSYNLVSAMAINMYYGHSQNPAALEALEKCWHWWYDFIFPDLSMPPALDCRVGYEKGSCGSSALCLPAHFYNKPEIRDVVEGEWKLRREVCGAPNQGLHTGPYGCSVLGFVALQYDKVLPDVTPAPRVWPEYHRSKDTESCVRRRNGWTTILCGITNDYCSNLELPLWRLERQVLVNLYHEKLGLLVGSAHSMMQEEVSTFTFYENGAAYYLHNHASLKSTAPLDTLHLRYGSNMGAVSVDTTKRDDCEITFSIHGEKGKRPARGLGHPITAMAARGRLSLRLKEGDTVRMGDQTWTLGEAGCIIRVPAGETVHFPGWSISCAEGWWNLHWPIHTSNPYNVLHPWQSVAIAEVPLWEKKTSDTPRPTATFRIQIET